MSCGPGEWFVSGRDGYGLSGSLLFVLPPVFLYASGAYRLSIFGRPGGLGHAAARSFALTLAVCCAAAAVSAGTAELISFILLYCLCSWALFCMCRLFILYYIHRRTKQGRHPVFCLLLGSYEQASRLAAALQAGPYPGIFVTGILTRERSDMGRVCQGGLTVIGTIDELGDILRKYVVDWAVFADGGEHATETQSLERQCRLEGVGFACPPRAYRGKGTLLSIEAINGIMLLESRPFPGLPVQRFLKRVTDCAVASIVILCSLPLWIIIPIAVKLTSPGPVLFIQERVGRNGRRFKMYKFRSMIRGAEQMQEKLQHLNEMEGPVFKIKNDPRFSSIGGFLRKTSIDELPQLFNVLKGEMSLVGPRPPLFSEVVQYRPGQRKRLSVTPGMTCLWQITGRNEIKFREWMLLDAEYIDNWSLMLDFKILIGTVRAVLLARGAN
jgi:exopolysaccharide biosynthesis polyprenyl glycosylphosphotransferase